MQGRSETDACFPSVSVRYQFGISLGSIGIANKSSTKHTLQDYMGRSTKPMGGFAGLAEAMAFATELQGDGTLHGHGFIALVNAWQHSSLQDIADRIDQYVSLLNVDDAMARLNSFMTHLSCEDHIDNDKHQASLDTLEEQFRSNNDGPKENIFLSCRSLGKPHAMSDFALRVKTFVKEPRVHCPDGRRVVTCHPEISNCYVSNTSAAHATYNCSSSYLIRALLMKSSS